MGEKEVLRLTFPPTRSVIRGIEGWQPSEERWLVRGLSILIRGPLRRADLPLTFEWEGEPLKLPLAAHLPFEGIDLYTVPQDCDSKEMWYDQRALLGRMCMAQAFFFDLDRETESALLEYRVERKEIDKKYVEDRLKLIEKTREHLFLRLGARLQGARGDDLPRADEAARRCISDCSQMFRKLAGRWAPDGESEPDWSLLGEACERFATGDLRAQVLVGREAHSVASWPVTLPDSAQIILFAELAFSAIAEGIEPRMWGVLLPHFVRMQYYYWARVKPRKQPEPFRYYGEPELPLSVADRYSIAQQIPVGRATPSSAALECKVHTKLIAYVSSFP